MIVEPSGASCGARISGVDLSGELSADLIADIRSTWLKHRVVAFTDQCMDDDALERFTIAMGGFGYDPFFDPIEGRKNIAAIKREADEVSPLFAENWHSDWSFLPQPPSGTCLLAIDIPPVGGDTLFSNQITAFAALPEQRKAELRRLTAIHSARRGYAPNGLYGDNDKGRSMAIRPSEAALAQQAHPLVKTHSETGEEALFCSLSYTVGIEGMSEEEALQLVMELHQWCEREEFVFRHQWEPGMLLLWDNRSVNHKATGGYEGYRRELHRTTIAA
ncbi:TauD/TfdA family dioxygenase [Erythrobacter sp. F6033]|uniref:TauD/TfdA dioxygenase family protein n=1 Tax=Erythrobacter sp. F6033 TaxID=2926401 RepID=UPI001FF3932A|nr:TauD/TfdA family dioxygenase [Erythrobacter sp. F6033]MCK0128337.1 TauD/TfdA family dioxygenase [Erythrobacter sp. F6033]